MSTFRKDLPLAAYGLACFKAGYFLALTAALLLWGDLGEFVRLPQRWVPKAGPGFASHFTGWDAGYYLSLSEQGYRTGDRACAFNPLWPLMVRWSSPLAGGNHLLAGLILANLFSAAGCLLFFVLTWQRFGSSAAKLGLIFLLLFPGSLFFQFVYSEPLFFLLVMFLWWGLDRGSYAVAAAAAFLLPLARGVGLFVVLPIGWQVVEPVGQWLRDRTCLTSPILKRMECGSASLRCDASGKPKIAPDLEGGGGVNNEGGQIRPGASLSLRILGWRVWLLAAPLAGWGAYLVLMACWTGNPFEGLEAQKYWGVHSVWNLINPPKFVLGLAAPTAWHAFTGSLLDRCVFLLVLYAMPLIWRMGKDMVVWTVMLALVPAMSGTFTSFIRFASCAFPVFIALGIFCSSPQRRILRYSLLALFTALHAVLLWRYANCRWAG